MITKWANADFVFFFHTRNFLSKTRDGREERFLLQGICYRIASIGDSRAARMAG